MKYENEFLNFGFSIPVLFEVVFYGKCDFVCFYKLFNTKYYTVCLGAHSIETKIMINVELMFNIKF